MHRRSLLSLLPLATVLAGCSAAGEASTSAAASGSVSSATTSGTAGATTVTDVLGRQVTLPAVLERVYLSESRLAYSLLFLQKDKPADKVVAWADDFLKAAPDMWRRLVKVAPDAEKVPVVGGLQQGDLSAENVLAHRPQVAVVTLDGYEAAKAGPFFDQLEAAGVPHVVVDFRKKPVENTRITVRVLGQIFGRTAEADRFLSHYDGIVGPILAADERRTAGRPSVFHWRSPGLSEPGRTYGDSNFGQITNSTGGANLGSELLDSDEGTVSTEELIRRQPDMIIASGGEWGQQKANEKSHTSFVHLGYDATEQDARSSLAALEDEPGYNQLKAFSEGRVYGIYHQFYNAPFNFVVFQAFARWQGLEGFGDVDVDAAWADFHERFMPFAAEGTVAVALGRDAR